MVRLGLWELRAQLTRLGCDAVVIGDDELTNKSLVWIIDRFSRRRVRAWSLFFYLKDVVGVAGSRFVSQLIDLCVEPPGSVTARFVDAYVADYLERVVVISATPCNDIDGAVYRDGGWFDRDGREVAGVFVVADYRGKHNDGFVDVFDVDDLWVVDVRDRRVIGPLIIDDERQPPALPTEQS